LFNEQSYQKIIDNSIVIANNETVFIIKKDSVIIDVLLNDQSIKIQLINVYYCSEIHYNLMSINQMKFSEYMYSIKNSKFLFMNAKENKCIHTSLCIISHFQHFLLEIEALDEAIQIFYVYLALLLIDVMLDEIVSCLETSLITDLNLRNLSDFRSLIRSSVII